MSLMPLLIWLASLGADPLMPILPQGTVIGPEVVPPAPAPPLSAPAPSPPSAGIPAPAPLQPGAALPPPVFSDSVLMPPPSGDSCNPCGMCDPCEMYDPCAVECCFNPFVIADPCPRCCIPAHEVFCDLLETINPWSRKTVRTVPGYYDPYGWQASYGIDGYQSWRLGWSIFHDWVVLPSSDVNGGAVGQMQITEWNSNLRWSEIIAPGVLFNGTGYFNAHYWDGPGAPDLPGQVDQISADLELGFFNNGPWSGQIAFHPQIVDGFGAKLNHYAFNYDGRVIASYRKSPYWTWVLGVGFWDRVNLLVIPHVGAVWTPGPRWELRLLYPKSKISYYLGQKKCKDYWLYASAEYTAEAWQANIGDPTVYHDRIQLTDYRVALGLRMDKGRHSFFIEGGYVFNRQAKFVGPTPDFDISSVGMVRGGFRF